jgi:hypothetical protein
MPKSNEDRIEILEHLENLYIHDYEKRRKKFNEKSLKLKKDFKNLSDMTNYLSFMYIRR